MVRKWPVNAPPDTSHFGYARCGCGLQALAGRENDFRDKVATTFQTALQRVTKVSAAGWFLRVESGGVLLI
jgi:hypothetical protein